MAFLSSMNISASGLTAQRLRMDVVAENLTNSTVTRTEAGGPYRRKMVVFEPIAADNFRQRLNIAMKNQTAVGGVRVAEIVEDPRPFKTVYNPGHPDANDQGYVLMPNVEILKETVDSMDATNAYSANITAINATKLMASRAIEIGK